MVRVCQPERLDTADRASASRNLHDLARINAWFGPHRILRGLLRALAGPDRRFSVLDIGAASGDMAACLLREFPASTVVSLDHHPAHLAGAPPPRLAADAFHLPFRRRSFDFVTASLVLHHYSEEEIVALLEGWRGVARRALVVLDLERHALPYWFLPSTRRLFGWHDITVHDGCASVRAGFRSAELAALASAAGGREAVVRRHPPWFRLSLVIPVLYSDT